MIQLFKFISVFVLVCNFWTTSGANLTPCKVDDFACQLATAKGYAAVFAEGNPALGIPSMDPLALDKITSSNAGLNMEFSNSVVTGLKGSVIESFQMDLNKLNLKFAVVIKVKMSGDYVLSGRLLILPIEGNGKYTIDVQKLRTDINADLVKKTGADGKEYYQIAKYTHKVDPLAPITYDFKNLFNGNKELGDAAISFANNNYKEVTAEVGGPVLDALHKKIIKYINTFLRKVPKEELFLQ